MYEGAPCPAVAVSKRVDGLELRVRKSGVNEDREVSPCHECLEILHEGGKVTVVRGHEKRVARVEVVAPNPHRLLA